LDPPGCGHFYLHHEIGGGCRGSREHYHVPMVRHEAIATQRDIELASCDVKNLCQDLEFRFTERRRAPPQAARDKEKGVSAVPAGGFVTRTLSALRCGNSLVARGWTGLPDPRVLAKTAIARSRKPAGLAKKSEPCATGLRLFRPDLRQAQSEADVAAAGSTIVYWPKLAAPLPLR